MPTPVYWNAVSHTSSETKKIHGINIKVSWQLYQVDGKYNWCREYHLKQDWDKVCGFVGKKLFTDKQYFNDTSKKMKKAKTAIWKWLTKIKKQEFMNR